MDDKIFTLSAWQAPAPYQNRRFIQQFLSKEWQENFQVGIELLNHAPLMFSTLNKKVEKESSDYESPNDFHWRLETSHSLQNPTIHDKLLDCCKSAQNREILQQLINDYQTHGRFAHFQTESLLHVIQEVLPSLLKMIKLAQNQLNNFFSRLIIPKSFFDDYKEYLFTLEYELGKIRYECVNAIFVRIQLALNSPTLQYDDALLDFIYSCRVIIPHFIPEEQLRSDEQKKFTRSLPKYPRQHLTQKRLLASIDIILNQGFEKQQKKLNHLLNMQENLATVKINDRIAFTIPDIVKRLHNLRHYPQWLFRGKKILKQLCSNKISFYLITYRMMQKKLHYLIETPHSLADLLTSTHGLHTHTINFLEKTLQCFVKKIEKINQSFLSGFWDFLDRGKTNRILEKYREYLIQHCLELLQMNIKLLNHLAEKMPEHKERLTDPQIQNIEKLLSQVFTWCEKFDCKKSMQEELQIIQKKLNPYLYPPTIIPQPIITTPPSTTPPNHTVDQITLFMQKLRDGKPLEKNEQTLLFYYIENLEIGLPEAEINFKQQHQDILDFAKTQLEQNFYHIDDLIENGKIKHDQIQYIIQLSFLIKTIGTEEEQQSLSRQIELVLIDYLSKCQTHYNESSQIIREHFIYCLGSEQQKLLVENVIKIQSNKEKYITECKKYLCTLQESNEKSIYAHTYYFQKQLLQTDTILFEYLRKLTHPALTNAQLKIFTDLRDKMICDNITNISKYPKLTQQEKVLLGLNSSTTFLSFMNKPSKINIVRKEIINTSAAMHLCLNECEKNTSMAAYLAARKNSRILLKNLLQQIPQLRSQLFNQNDKLNFCLDPIPQSNSDKNTFFQPSHQPA